MDARTAIVIGQARNCRQVERQLDLLGDQRPTTFGWVVVGTMPPDGTADDQAILGAVDSLESIIARRPPAMALICLPAVMADLVQTIRTRLRRLGVPDRFMPTLQDQLAGVGPRSEIDIDLAALIDRPPRQIDEAAIRSVIEGRRVLITGAGGSIGSELARLVSRYSPALLVLADRAENALFEIDRQVARRSPRVARQAALHDVVDAARTRELFQRHRPQIVFHAAAHKHVPMMEDHPAQAVDNNLFGTKSVADAARDIGAERFVMISTDKAVNPSSIMGATKRLAELYVQHLNRQSSTGFSMVRFGNVLGSSGSVLDIWARQLADGGPLTVTDPAMTRYFMTIPEAAALVVQSAALLDTGCDDGEVFVLDMGPPVRVLDLARRFIELHGLAARMPGQAGSGEHAAAAGTIDILFTGARPGEKIFEELAYDAEVIRPTRHADISIWRLRPPGAEHVERMLEAADPLRRPRNPQALAELIRSLVPEMTAAALAA